MDEEINLLKYKELTRHNEIGGGGQGPKTKAVQNVLKHFLVWKLFNSMKL